MNTNFNKILTSLFPYMTAIIFAYGISILFYTLLPKYGIEENNKALNNIEYTHYNINYTFNTQKQLNKIVAKKTKQKNRSSFALLSNITLKAVYATADHQGWIIIEEKKTKKTHILEYANIFNHYKLIGIYRDHVIFEKQNKEYRLEFKPTKKLDTKKLIRINKQKLKNYTDNPNKIWKNINIQEYKPNGYIEGFEVKNIVRGSLFAQIGLKRGDVIQQINNSELRSSSDALTLYQKLKKTKNLNISILRDNLQMELNYEIH